MKLSKLITMALAWLPLSLSAATFIPVEVDSSDINCVFSLDCSNRVLDSSSPIRLPGTSGIGYIQTRVVKGEDGSVASGLYGYQYRVDLSAVEMNPNRPPCYTNFVRCYTRQVLTNLVTCVTNGMCVTNIFQATNVVTCFTNTIPAREILQCITDSTGTLACYTNQIPATNVVTCITNRLPRQRTVVCSGPVDIDCMTNRLYVTVTTCETNLIPCPRTTPCIETITIDFGPSSSLDLDSDGLPDLSYFIYDGAFTPDQVVQTGRQVTLQFSPPICPGDSSAFVGLFSTRLPQDKRAVLSLTSGGTLNVSVLAPSDRVSLDCDFDKLIKEIKDLKQNDMVGSNRRTCDSHRDDLLHSARAAEDAAEQGDVDGVAHALAAIICRVDGGNDDWVTNHGGRDLCEALQDLQECLSQAFGDHGNGHGHGDDRQDDHGDGHGDGHGNGHGNGHR